MSKHLYRIKLDQRHALHDPRFGKARSIRLGLGSVKIFNDLLQGYSKGNNEHTADLTENEKRLIQRANEKEEITYANPAEQVISQLLPDN